MKLFTRLVLLIIPVAVSTKSFSQCQNTPAAPVTTNDTVDAPGGIATLTATGDSVRWYAVPVGGSVIATGNTFTTPFLTATTTYYATDFTNEGGDQYHGGKLYHSGSTGFSTNNVNAKMYFNVTDTVTLVSVKVYTDFAGDRLIRLHDSNGTLLDSDTIYIVPDSMVLMLNYQLLPGTGYYLTTDSAVNQQIPQNNNYPSPRLRRNSSSVSYPYNIGPVGTPLATITGNDQGSTALYYYFYDWVIETPLRECESARTPAEVFYDNSIGIEDIHGNDLVIFPNPANNYLTIQTGIKGNALLRLYDMSGRNMKQMDLTDSLHSIDLSQLTPGIYSLHITSDSHESVTKLVIQR